MTEPTHIGAPNQRRRRQRAILALLVALPYVILLLSSSSWGCRLPVRAAVSTAAAAAAAGAAGSIPGNGRRQRPSKAIAEQLYGLGPEASLQDRLAYLDLLDDADLAPLTKRVQRWLWAKQHPDPSTCSKQLFVVGGVDLPTGHNGFGSCIHLASRFLSGAVQNDRILVYDAGFCSSLVDPGCGRGEHDTHNILCLLEPPSSCGLEHVTKHNSVPFYQWNGTEVFPTDSNLTYAGEIPPFLERLLRKHFDKQHVKLTPWFLKWRAQSAAYLARLNKPTLKAVADLRRRPDVMLHLTPQEDDSGNRHLAVPLPLPPGTLYLHVRHGNKATEMKLIELGDLLEAAEPMINTNPLQFKKFAYLASDDADVFTQAEHLPQLGTDLTSPDEEWVIITSNSPRLDAGMLEWDEELKAFGASNQIVHHLLNLLVALECDAWAGTRGSNWLRLIDELRCVWVNKCGHPFLEAGHFLNSVGYGP